MTEEEQNIAIAKACGCEYHKPTEQELASGSYYQYVPNFTSDLNAMHEVERTFSFKQSAVYDRTLDDVVNREFREGGILVWPTWHATAAQRAEAFLRCMGLWTDEINKSS